MKPLTKQSYSDRTSSNPWKEGYFFTEEELEQFIGEVFDKARELKSGAISNSIQHKYSHKSELIKQLLQ